MGVLVGHPVADGAQVVARGGGRRWAGCRRGLGTWGVIVGRAAADAGARRCTARPAAGIVGGVAATVSTPVFEGPVDLLLQLVNSHQLDIYDIPLAAVVDAFVAEVAALGVGRPPDACPSSWSSPPCSSSSSPGACCPAPTTSTPTRSWSGWEERDLLLARLLECQAYAAAADGFAVLIEQAARSVPRTAGLDARLRGPRPRPARRGDPRPAWPRPSCRATAERPAPIVDLYHVTVDTVTVADAVAELERAPARRRARPPSAR